MPRDCELCGVGANNCPPEAPRCGKHGGVMCAACHESVARDKTGRLPFCRWHGPDLCLFPGCAETQAGTSLTCKKHVSEAETAVASQYAQKRQEYDRSVQLGAAFIEDFVQEIGEVRADFSGPKCCAADECVNDAKEGHLVCAEHAKEEEALKKRGEETLNYLMS